MHQNYKILEVFFVTIYMMNVYNFLTMPSLQRIDGLLIISFWKKIDDAVDLKLSASLKPIDSAKGPLCIFLSKI
jgi:hypothetical protein